VESRFGGVSNALFAIGETIGPLENFFSILRNKHGAGKILALNVGPQISVDVPAMGIALCETAQSTQADYDCRNFLTEHKHFNLQLAFRMATNFDD